MPRPNDQDACPRHPKSAAPDIFQVIPKYHQASSKNDLSKSYEDLQIHGQWRGIVAKICWVETCLWSTKALSPCQKTKTKVPDVWTKKIIHVLFCRTKCGSYGITRCRQDMMKNWIDLWPCIQRSRTQDKLKSCLLPMQTSWPRQVLSFQQCLGYQTSREFPLARSASVICNLSHGGERFLECKRVSRHVNKE